jgi:hypothetical protein
LICPLGPPELAAAAGLAAAGAAAGLAQKKYLADQPPFPGDETGIRFQTGAEAMADPKQRFKLDPRFANVAEGGRIGYDNGGDVEDFQQFMKEREKG